MAFQSTRTDMSSPIPPKKPSDAAAKGEGKRHSGEGADSALDALRKTRVPPPAPIPGKN